MRESTPTNTTTAPASPTEIRAHADDFQLLSRALPRDAFDLLKAASKLDRDDAQNVITLTGPGTRALLLTFGLLEPDRGKGGRSLAITVRGWSYLEHLVKHNVAWSAPLLSVAEGWKPLRRVLPADQYNRSAAASAEPATAYLDLYAGADTEEVATSVPEATIKVSRLGTRARVWQISGAARVGFTVTGEELDAGKGLTFELEGLAPSIAVRELFVVKPAGAE